MADHPIAGERLPLPVGLTEPWTTPDDAGHHWVRDRVHAPHQVTVLDYDFWTRFVDNGLSFAFQLYSLPCRYRSRRFWTRYYSEYDDGGAAQDLSANLVLDTAANELGERWTESWLPEIQSFTTYLFGLDVTAATDEELAAYLDGAIRRLRRGWELHFESTEASGRVWDWYFKLYTELFEGATESDAAQLLLALPNMTTAAGHALWRLRDLAANMPTVRNAFESPDSEGVLAALAAAPEAALFLDGFQKYLHEFCRRPPYVTLCERTLQEDPRSVISQLRDALAHPERDPEQHRAALAIERERAIEAARTALVHHPQPIRDEFDRLLALAHSAIQYKEDHSFYIDFQLSAAARRIPVEIGRRLAAAGALEDQDDFIHLTLAELRSSLVARPATDRRSLVAERRAEMAHCAALDVPTEIGTKPPPSPSDASASPTPEPGPEIGSEIGAQPGVLRGTAVSAGTGRGRARVVAGLNEAQELRPGEVLVAPSTSQPWTPLFATAAGLVTETGGVLSHAAIVAREYRLPAVARVKDALTLLRTGMLLEVDGSAGTVRIVDEE